MKNTLYCGAKIVVLVNWSGICDFPDHICNCNCILHLVFIFGVCVWYFYLVFGFLYLWLQNFGIDIDLLRWPSCGCGQLKLGFCNSQHHLPFKICAEFFNHKKHSKRQLHWSQMQLIFDVKLSVCNFLKISFHRQHISSYISNQLSSIITSSSQLFSICHSHVSSIFLIPFPTRGVRCLFFFKTMRCFPILNDAMFWTMFFNF